MEGLSRLAAQLLPGGVFALWSDDPREDTFFHDLAEVFDQPEPHVVEFHNPILECDSASTVYLARRKAVNG